MSEGVDGESAVLLGEGWRPEESTPLVDAFGDDVVLELIRRSSRDPKVLIVWVGWYRLPPSIFLVNFGELSASGTPWRREYTSVDEILHSSWGSYFVPEQAVPERPDSGP